MNPFSIICQSCAARLKVTKLSAIGQSLACPSCGSMVRVVPPDDWQAPPELIAPPDSTDASDATDATAASAESGLGSSFEDIDSILPTVSAVRPARNRKPAGPAATNPSRSQPQSPRVPTPRPVSIDVAQPVLPGDEWTTREARARKRLILMLASCVATVLLVAAAIAAILMNRPADNLGGADPDRVAQVENPVPSLPLVEDPQAESEPKRTESDSTGIGGSPHPIPQDGAFTSPAGGAAGPENGTAPRDDSGFTAPVAADPNLGNDAEATPSVVGGDAPPLTGIPGTAPPLDPQPEQTPVAVTTDAVDQLDNRLGDLASLLQESDASLQDLQDAAVMMRARSENGITKYLIEPPDPVNLNLDRQLDLSVGGMLFEQAVPMTQMLRLVTTLSGVPITVDARSIVLTGRPINPEGKLKLTDSSVLESVEAIASQFGLSLVREANGLVLTTSSDQQLVHSRYDFPAIPGLTDTEKAKFIASIKTLIAPQAWLREAEPATIEIEQDQLVVDAEPEIQLGIQLLIEKLDAAAASAAAPDALSLLVSRWSASHDNRQRDPGTQPRTSQTLAALFNQLRKQTGVTVLVDWRQVLSAGWTAATLVPGNLDEPTVDALVDEVARAMDMTVVGVDATTLLLTSQDAAKRMIDLEVYPVGKVLAEQLDADTVEELVFNTLGAQLQENLVRVIYEPKCRAVIVIAPQAIQRQIESILGRVDQR